MLNHAPDLRKNDTTISEFRRTETSASGKAARYFTDLQHLRKRFWERYRHVLIPIIRTQIQQSGVKRLTQTTTNLGLRQTKKSDKTENLKRAILNFGLRSTKRKRSGDVGSSIINDFEDFVDPEEKKFKRYQFDHLMRFGRSTIKKRPEDMFVRMLRSANEKRPDDMFVRMLRSGMKNEPKNKNKKDVSMMHFLAYSLLGKQL